MMLDMEKPSSDFKGIWIPKDIWLSDQLSLMEKVLFVEIHSLDNERGCYAGNKYFSEFFGKKMALVMVVALLTMHPIWMKLEALVRMPFTHHKTATSWKRECS